MVAIFIGSVEALGQIGGRLGLEGRFWSLVGNLNESLSALGYAVVGIFATSWIASLLIYRLKGFHRLPTGAS